MSGPPLPVSSLTSGVRSTVAAIRCRATSMSPSAIGRTGSIILSSCLHCKFPRGLSQHRYPFGHFCRARMACGAVDHAFLYALDDARQAEQIVGEIPVEPVGHGDARA